MERIDAFALYKVVHDVCIHVGCIRVELEEGMVVASHECGANLERMFHRWLGLVLLCQFCHQCVDIWKSKRDAKRSKVRQSIISV